MKTIIKISLSDAERSHISNIYHNNSSSKLASRKEVTELVQAFVEQLLDGDGQTYKDVFLVIFILFPMVRLPSPVKVKLNSAPTSSPIDITNETHTSMNSSIFFGWV